MIRPVLSILGTGVHHPAPHSVDQTVHDLGGDTSRYRSWERFCLAGEEEHPSTMAAAALRRAMEVAEVRPSDLRLVIAAGMARDYPPSWSVAIEVMHLVGTPDTTLGIDLTLGCVGSLAALQSALGWLTIDGAGYAAVVVGERWAYTVDRSDSTLMGLWAHSDGGAALVVGLGPSQASLAEFAGAAFVTRSAYNGRVLVKYGGTRYPAPAHGEAPYLRSVAPTDRHEVRDTYLAGYTEALDLARRGHDAAPHSLVCNQLSPGMVNLIGSIAGVPQERTVVTGHDTGHQGAADLIVGLDQVLRDGPVRSPVMAAASSAYAFGAGLVLPPAGTHP